MPLIRIAMAAVAFLSLAGSGTLAAQSPGRFEPATLPSEVNDDLQLAASVTEINDVPNQGNASVKLFGIGADTAMNGLYTYIAFFGNSDNGWRIFSLGNILDYRIVSASRGRLLLQFREHTDSDGAIGTRRVIIRWTPGTDDSPPATVTIGPAR
jgi:hypothetical protein